MGKHKARQRQEGSQPEPLSGTAKFSSNLPGEHSGSRCGAEAVSRRLLTEASTRSSQYRNEQERAGTSLFDHSTLSSRRFHDDPRNGVALKRSTNVNILSGYLDSRIIPHRSRLRSSLACRVLHCYGGSRARLNWDHIRTGVNFTNGSHPCHASPSLTPFHPSLPIMTIDYYDGACTVADPAGVPPRCNTSQVRLRLRDAQEVLSTSGVGE